MSKRGKNKGDREALVKQAAMLTGAVFSGISMLRGPHWALFPQEQDAIATAAADLLESMPDSAAERSAEVLEKFAAPFALASALGTAVMSRVIYEQSQQAKQLQLQQQAAAARQSPPAPSPSEVNNVPAAQLIPDPPQTQSGAANGADPAEQLLHTAGWA